MKANFTYLGVVFTIHSTCTAQGITSPWDKKSDTRHNQHRVHVKTDKGRTSFNFYGSHYDYQNGVIELSENHLKDALNCLVSDGLAGAQTFEDFCSEFGYNEDSRSAERIYKACKKAAAKLARITDVDPCDIINEMNENE